MRLSEFRDPWIAILIALLVSAAMIAWIDIAESSQTWLRYVDDFLIFALSALLVASACADAASQTRSHHQQLGRVDAPKLLWRERLLVLFLAMAPALFSLFSLSCLIWSWFGQGLGPGTPLFFFLLIFGPPRIRKKTEAKIRQYVAPRSSPQ